MPTINIFYKHGDADRRLALDAVRDDLKKFVAQTLTCQDIKLKPEEISVRLVGVDGEGMIGKVEIEITAHAFKERIENQDQICLKTAAYLHEKLGMPLDDIKVWLVLAELGHSWK